MTKTQIYIYSIHFEKETNVKCYVEEKRRVLRVRSYYCHL